MIEQKQNAPSDGGVMVDLAGGLESTNQKTQAESSHNGATAQAQIYIDPEFKALIPPLHPDEYAQLEANILAEGCRDALVLWDDVLVDGHNRYEICQTHGLPFNTVQNPAIHSIDDAVLWIVNNQLGRRNITSFVRGELALRAKPIIEARARAKQATSTGGAVPQLMQNSAQAAPITTRQAVATAAGVSHDTIRKIEKIQDSAAPEVLMAVRAGAISINAAAKVATLPAEQQSAITAAGPAEVRKVAAEITKAEGGKAAAPVARETPPVVLGGEESPAAEIADLAPELSEIEQLRNELADVREQAALMAEEIQTYKAIAEGDAAKEIRRLQEVNKAQKSQLDDYMNRNQELKQKLKALERRAGVANA